ncbi:MAG: RAxF-45 family protein [Tuberibacillus sp.]
MTLFVGSAEKCKYFLYICRAIFAQLAFKGISMPFFRTIG